MKESRDFSCVKIINDHFNDLWSDLILINNCDEFKRSKFKRGIMFDFLQIGELVNRLSDTFLNNFHNKNVKHVISIRNRIVHNYTNIDDEIIFNTLKKDLKKFIDDLSSFSREYYLSVLKTLLGKTTNVIVDRPINYNHNDITYELNYGYIKEMTALDGELQDAYILDVKDPVDHIVGKIIGIVHRLDDVEDKLLVVSKEIALKSEEIKKLINFQEKYFKYELILCSENV